MSVRPLGADGSRYPSYADALRAVARPSVLEDRPSYRLIDAAWSAHGGRMEFTQGSYFDTINTCEAVAHELAAAVRRRDSDHQVEWEDVPFRRLVGDPCDPVRRSMLPAITTLTLRADSTTGDGTFLVHWRDPEKVASGGGLYQVAPVGVFQPAGTSPTADHGDFDLWRCMAREFDEELLGHHEHADVDYRAWPFYQSLQEGRRHGLCRPYCLGLGVDPLTLVTDILAVVVFDDELFDGLFGGLVTHNTEGETTGGMPFTEERIAEFLTSKPMQPAGAAVLDLAWRHRDTLLTLD